MNEELVKKLKDLKYQKVGIETEPTRIVYQRHLSVTVESKKIRFIYTIELDEQEENVVTMKCSPLFPVIETEKDIEALSKLVGFFLLDKKYLFSSSEEPACEA